MGVAQVRRGSVIGIGALAVLCASAVVVARARQTSQPASRQTPQQTSPQTPPPAPRQPVPVFRAGVNVVRVDVSVTGRGDKPVTNLQASDFEIEEDGVRQKVDTVQFLRLDGQAAPGDDESLPIRSREHAEAEAAKDDVRLFAVFLDDYHVEKIPAITIPLREALVHFVDSLGPTDLVSVMYPLTPLSALEFTRSRATLEATMRAFEGRLGQIFPIKSPAEEAQLRSGDLVRIRAQVTLSSLTALVTYLGGLRDGRKSVLFVSQGPPVGPFSDLNQDVDDLLRAANRGNVTINVLDPRGLGQSPFGGADVMYRLAQETGGRRIVNTNNLEGGLNEVIGDASAYYLLGYTPAREFADGKFHRIIVKVDRPGVRVIARRGYWAPTAAEMTSAADAAANPARPGLSRALSKLADAKAARVVDVWLGVSRGSGETTRLTITWQAARTAGGAKAPPTRLEIEPITRNGGKALADAQTLASADAAAFDLAPGDLALRFTALDKDGGTVDQWVEPVAVPALAGEPLALATPRFLRARSPFEFRALLANPHPVPEASPLFRPADRVLVEIECYHTGTQTPAVTVELLNAQGQSLVSLEMPPLVDGRTRLEIPVSSLAPSEYVLRVRAKAGERQVERLAAFRVAR